MITEDRWGSNVHPTAIVGGEPQHFARRFHRGERHMALVDPEARIGPFTTVDDGTERQTTVERGAYVMGHCNVGHDAIVGANAQVADSCVIAGHAEIGPRARLGIGVMVTPYRKVGTGARIGAGSTVLHDIPAFALAHGSPARVHGWFCFAGCWNEVEEQNDICAACLAVSQHERTLRCEVCGEAAWWSSPREDDPCPNMDGGLVKWAADPSRGTRGPG